MNVLAKANCWLNMNFFFLYQQLLWIIHTPSQLKSCIAVKVIQPQFLMTVMLKVKPVLVFAQIVITQNLKTEG